MSKSAFRRAWGISLLALLAIGCDEYTVSIAWLPGRPVLALSEPLEGESCALRLLSRDGARELLRTEEALMDLVASPDGNSLAFIEMGERPRLRVVDVARGEDRLVLPLLPDTEPPPRGSISFAPDGTRLALMAGWGEEASPVWLVEVETGAVAVLPLPASHGCFPAWSPVGDGIAILVGSPETERFDLVVVDPETGASVCRQIDVTDGESGLPPGMIPRWSPDGARVACVVPREDDGALTIDGLEVAGPVDGHLPVAWSPDGTRLAVKGEHDRLALAEAGGPGALQVWEEGAGEIHGIAWGGPGLAVVGEGPGGRLVRIVDPETGAARPWPDTPREALRLALVREEADAVSEALRRCPPDDAGWEILGAAAECLEKAGRLGAAARALRDAVDRLPAPVDEERMEMQVWGRAHLALLLAVAGEGDPALEFGIALPHVAAGKREAADRFRDLLVAGDVSALRVAVEGDEAIRDLTGGWPAAAE